MLEHLVLNSYSNWVNFKAGPDTQMNLTPLKTCQEFNIVYKCFLTVMSVQYAPKCLTNKLLYV